ncbi:MAG TPA: Flp family type IVb pilin [Paraburkholderia sp.]|jgi:pilus assembly protein Flp/PilA|nr:Flp family type IVb pilin [Paraburkholderia sp.]
MFSKICKRFARDERGVSAMEYAVLAGIVVLAVAAAGTLLSDSTNGLPGMFTKLLNNVNTVIGAPKS